MGGAGRRPSVAAPRRHWGAATQGEDKQQRGQQAVQKREDRPGMRGPGRASGLGLGGVPAGVSRWDDSEDVNTEHANESMEQMPKLSAHARSGLPRRGLGGDRARRWIAFACAGNEQGGAPEVKGI